MKKIKRLAAALLTAALLASLVVLPASAAPGSFGDVADQKTAVNADILRLMGVVSGTGDNRFNPGGTLTRAQFATMVVNFLQRGEDTPRYATRTIFSDVRSGHWARSYVNLAASIMITDGTGENARQIPLISGVGDGRFLPDEKITMAEAVTILLRALGYTGDKAGAVWPQGYMDLAESVGLSSGVSAGAGAAISRAEAAQLFVNALRCKNAEGKVYYETLGNVAQDKTIILAVGVATDDGSSTGAIRTTNNASSEAYLPAHGDGNPTALQGRRGYLVLNDKEEIVTFVPDDSVSTTITIGEALPGYVKAGSKQYTVSSNTKVYASGSMEGKDYLSVLNGDSSILASGTQITMYSEKGKIVAIYSTGGATTAPDAEAVVVLSNVNAATFYHLTGGGSNFNIMKDRQTISMSQIKPYDVVTYDQVNNTLMVSGLRLTAVYDPEPSAKTPKTVKAGGQSLGVLESAWDTIGDVKPGDSVSLLLTADGKVGGILPATSQLRSTAIGTISGSSVSVFLPNGGTLELSGSVTGSVPDGQPVVVSATKSGLSISRLPELRAPGEFKVNRMKLGDYTVSSGVRIYEQVSTGVTQTVSRSDLTMESIPADKIATYHLNSSNIVDYIVLKDVTGDAYIYGMMVGGYESDKNNPDKDRYIWHLRSGSQDISFSPTVTYNGQSGDMVAVVLGSNREGQATVRGVTKLQEIKNVKREDFFESEGSSYVRYRGQTYRIADRVECYYSRSGNAVAKENWLTGGTVASIKEYSDTFTIYVDSIGNQVRIIKANR